MKTDRQKTLDRQHRERAALDTRIRSMPPTDAYRDGWERTFGKKSAKAKTERELEQAIAEGFKRVDAAIRKTR